MPSPKISSNKAHSKAAKGHDAAAIQTVSTLAADPSNQWKRGFRVAIILAAVSTVYTVYRHMGGHAKGFLTVPESYALCTEGGKVYTVEVSAPNADCVLVNRDRVLGTGTIDEIEAIWEVFQNETVRKFYGNEPTAKKPLIVYHTKPGSIVVPGLADAHAHLIDYGFKVQMPLDSAQSLDEILDILEAYVEAHTDVQKDPEHWIRGMGWDQTRWKDWTDGFPTAQQLASRTSLASRPISLSRVDGHALWVSPRAIELARDALPGQNWPSDGEIEGGEIQRDSEGNPSGVFVDTAMELIPVPPYSDEEMEEFALRGFSDALSVGLTSVHDASSMQSDIVDVYKTLADEGKLPIRLYAMASPDTPADERLDGYGVSGRLDMKSVKVFTDGALGSWGAALLEPYSDRPSTSGLMRTTEVKLEQLVNQIWNDGWGVNIHCIGDRANKAVLDIYERLLKNGSGDPLLVSMARRPRIEHAQVMRVEDLKRAGELGVITSVQPTHATSDMWYAETRLGPERVKGAYAYKTLLRASPNGVLPLGSDFPVEGINPLLGFYAAVARLDVDGNSPHGTDGWYASEKLTRAEALKGMTLDAAYASFAETELGSLAAGKKADFVILDQDIMDEQAVPYREIPQTKVLTTVLDGRIVFGSI